jgi:hypothetical protein
VPHLNARLPPSGPNHRIVKDRGSPDPNKPGYRLPPPELGRYSLPLVASDAKKTGKEMKKALSSRAPAAPNQEPDPLAPGALTKMAWRAAIPIGVAWVIGGIIFSISQSSWAKWLSLGIPALLTLGIVGLLFWALKQAGKARSMAGILGGVQTAEDRQAAIERLEANYKANDPAAIFAKAQLIMQEDPRQALVVLEQINLSKVTATVADEARAQRAMVHLMVGEVQPARDLADGIDLARHQDARTRAMMGSVVAESWSRSGQAKRAKDTLDLFNPEDAELEQIRPQLYRARAFVFAGVGDVKAMRRALRKLLEIDVRLLGGFMLKKTHPLLQREAKKLLEQSGQVPRKMQVQRRI